MEMQAVAIEIDEERVVESLQEAAKTLDSAEGELALDFSSVRRIDAGSIRALEELARNAAAKDVKVVLRGVNVSVYKVLRVVKMASRFSFVL